MKKWFSMLFKVSILPLSLQILLDTIHHFAPFRNDAIGTMLLFGVALMIGAPVYFFIKGDTKHPWLYPIVTVILQQLLFALPYFTIYARLPEFEPIGYAVVHLIRSIFFTLIAVVDIFMMLCHRTRQETDI